MEGKLDELLQSFSTLKKSHEESQRQITAKLDRLEQDVATGQEETLQLVAKKLKRDPEYQFHRKGNEKQFVFNEEVNDSIQSAASFLEKIKPTAAQDTAILKSAKEQLQQGTKAISERQKLIRLADRSDYGWQLVEAYQRDELADNEKDTKKIEEAEKAVELQNRRKRKQAGDKGKMDLQPSTGFRPPQFMGSFGFPPPPPFIPPFIPPPINPPVPFPWSVGPAGRLPGPCFQCLQMGHLKAQCPNKISRPYPFNDVLISSVSSMHDSVNKGCAEVCGASQCVDKPQVSRIGHSKAGSRRAQVFDVHVEDARVYQGSREGPSSSGSNDLDIVVSRAHDPDSTELQRYWELEESETQIRDVQGRLKNKLSFWKDELQAPVPIIDCISEGYKLPLLSPPPSYSSKNQSSAHQNADFVSSAITELLQNRCVQRISYKPHICSPLSVVANSMGKLRLVLNLRYLNQFLLKEKFKYEDLRVAMLMFQPDDYMFSNRGITMSIYIKSIGNTSVLHGGRA